jgi:protein-disulfide isomerase
VRAELVRVTVLALAIAALASPSVAPAASDGKAAEAAPAPRVQVAIDDSPVLGPNDSAVTIVEFSDFHCPYSAQGTLALRRLVKLYPDKLRLVFKHYPLGARFENRAAHRAAIAAGAQNRFWDMHDWLFSNQRAGRHGAIDYARELGLNVDAFLEVSGGDDSRARIQRDLELGRQLQVIATPTYFVNGTRVIGAKSLQDWRTLIEQELAVSTQSSPR